MQEPPFAIQVELVEGCTLACEFCGINGIRDKPGNFKFMATQTACRLAEEIRRVEWNARIEFAMHGEPSLHPELHEVMKTFREALPKASLVLFSNGSGFLRDTSANINGLLEAGLNTLGLDAYEHVNIVPRVMERYDGKYPVYHYPLQIEHNLHSGRRVGHRDIVVIKDISLAFVGNHSTINTHCGGGTEPSEELPLQQRCAKPFRELSIRWDGNVAICCNDFRGIYKIANINDTPIEELWQHERFDAARKKLYHSDRGFDPCRFCNARSMRIGLLPDKKGRETLEPPTEHDEELIKQAIAGPPLTRPVLRRWEADGRESLPLLDPLYSFNVIPDRR